MHEMMVAQSLLTMITAEANKQQARPVTAKISCGSLNPVNEEVLGFAFEAIAKNTICEGMKLQVESNPIKGKCRDCKHIFSFDIYSPSCPGCSSENFELLPDAPLLLETIEF